jgi:hypothetical protein
VGIGAASVFALLISVAAVWTAVRLDAFLFFFDLAGQRARAALFDAVGSAIANTFGDAAVDALRTGGMPAIVGITGFLALVVLAAVGLRAVLATARRRRICRPTGSSCTPARRRRRGRTGRSTKSASTTAPCSASTTPSTRPAMS